MHVTLAATGANSSLIIKEQERLSEQAASKPKETEIDTSGVWQVSRQQQAHAVGRAGLLQTS